MTKQYVPDFNSRMTVEELKAYSEEHGYTYKYIGEGLGSGQEFFILFDKGLEQLGIASMTYMVFEKELPLKRVY